MNNLILLCNLRDALHFLRYVKQSELTEQQVYDLNEAEKRIKSAIEYLDKD